MLPIDNFVLSMKGELGIKRTESFQRFDDKVGSVIDDVFLCKYHGRDEVETFP